MAPGMEEAFTGSRNDDEYGYNTNFQGKTGESDLEPIEKIAEVTSVAYETTIQTTVAAQKLANKIAGTTSEILDGGKVAEGIGRNMALLGMGITAADGLINGWKNHHVADLGIDAAIYIISAEVPVAGWIVGGSYFIGNLIFRIIIMAKVLPNII